MKEMNEKMREHKNNANARARKELKKNGRLERRVASLVAGASSAKAMKSKLREDVRQRLDAAEADKVAAEERAEEAEEELLLLEEHIEVIKEKIGRARKACLLPDQSQLQSAARKIEAGAMAAAASRVAAPTGKALYGMLGKTGEAYSQDIIELGLTLMAAQLTAPGRRCDASVRSGRVS